MNSHKDNRIRSALLAHWTGSDFDKDVETKELTEKLREEYVKRFISTLETGLWLNLGNEAVEGWESGDNRKRNILHSVPRVCFTELRLKDSLEHIKRYGRMAFVFQRNFIERCGGGPVIYAGFRDWRSTNLDEVRKLLEDLAKEDQIQLNRQPKLLTKDFLLKAHNALGCVMAYLKNMHSLCGHDPCITPEQCLTYDYYDEYEWRVIHTHREQDAGMIVENKDPKFKARFFLKFKVEDLKFGIVPDGDTLKMIKDKIGNQIKFHTIDEIITDKAHES